jgi:hypothetical protein
MTNTSGSEPDTSRVLDVIRRSAQQLRQDEARYASPALTFKAPVPAAPGLVALKQMDALLLHNAYSDPTYAAIFEQLQGYLSTLPELRRVPLGEVRSAQVQRAELTA